MHNDNAKVVLTLIHPCMTFQKHRNNHLKMYITIWYLRIRLQQVINMMHAFLALTAAETAAAMSVTPYHCSGNQPSMKIPLSLLLACHILLQIIWRFALVYLKLSCDDCPTCSFQWFSRHPDIYCSRTDSADFLLSNTLHTSANQFLVAVAWDFQDQGPLTPSFLTSSGLEPCVRSYYWPGPEETAYDSNPLPPALSIPMTVNDWYLLQTAVCKSAPTDVGWRKENLLILIFFCHYQIL